MDEPLLGVAEMPHAICSSPNWSFIIKLHDIERGQSIATPDECPCCASAMISICPQCGFLLTGNPEATRCSLCQADLKVCFCNEKGRRSIHAGSYQLARQALMALAPPFSSGFQIFGTRLGMNRKYLRGSHLLQLRYTRAFVSKYLTTKLKVHI